MNWKILYYFLAVYVLGLTVLFTLVGARLLNDDIHFTIVVHKHVTERFEETKVLDQRIIEKPVINVTSNYIEKVVVQGITDNNIDYLNKIVNT